MKGLAPGQSTPARRFNIGLLLLAGLAFFVHGYHLGVDDAAIYIPGIKKAADPALYPFGAQFFESHARLSIFSQIVGAPLRILPMSADWMILLWHFASILLLLIGCWQIACVFFETAPARWGAVTLVAACFSVPVAGTALSIMDPYLTARSLSTPTSVLAIAAYVSGKNKQAAAWLVLMALVHPQMAAYSAALLVCVAVGNRLRVSAVEMVAASALPFVFSFQPAAGPAREALLSRTYFFVGNWAWYEWAGVIAPLAVLWWIGSAKLRNATPAMRLIARALVPYGVLFTVAGLFTLSPTFENFARLQPMRAFHLLYIIFFVMLGGLLGEYVLQGKTWRWIAVFVPLAAGMALLQWSTYPASPHVEWPGLGNNNPWTSAFLWIRTNTPKDAVFAIDPDYMIARGEDLHGFRAVAERSVLADRIKDSGAVSLFPELADEWQREVQAQTGLAHFQPPDFVRLRNEYPVTWIVTPRAGTAALTCPYHNQELSVCRLDPP